MAEDNVFDEYNDQDPNPFPVYQKGRPKAGATKDTELLYELDDDLNENIRTQFDNKWLTTETTKRNRPYPGKNLEHKYASVSLHNKTGKLTAKTGYFYRLYNCTVEELTTEAGSCVYLRDCTITKITGGTDGDSKARIFIVNSTAPLIEGVVNTSITSMGETTLEAVTGATNSDFTFYQTKAWSGATVSSLTSTGVVIKSASIEASGTLFDGCEKSTITIHGTTVKTGADLINAFNEGTFSVFNSTVETGANLCNACTKSSLLSASNNYTIGAAMFIAEDCTVKSKEDKGTVGKESTFTNCKLDLGESELAGAGMSLSDTIIRMENTNIEADITMNGGTIYLNNCNIKNVTGENSYFEFVKVEMLAAIFVACVTKFSNVTGIGANFTGSHNTTSLSAIAAVFYNLSSYAQVDHLAGIITVDGTSRVEVSNSVGTLTTTVDSGVLDPGATVIATGTMTDLTNGFVYKHSSGETRWDSDTHIEENAPRIDMNP